MKAGWELKTLGEITVLENGDRGKNYPGRKAFVISGVPFINAGHIADGKIDWAEMNYIPEEHFQRISRGKITKNDLLFCLRGSLGKFGHVTEDIMGAIASSLVIIRATYKIDVNFLKQFLGSAACAEEIEKYAAGAAQPNLGATDLKKFKIPLPPLEEQKRIVSILDEAFEGLDRARENAEANLKSARELFDATLQSTLYPKGTIGWEIKSLGDICSIVSGSGFPKRFQGKAAGEYPFFKVGDMNTLGNETNLSIANNYISETIRKELGARIVPQNSVVFPKVGGAISTNKKRQLAHPSCIDNNVMGLVPNQEMIDPSYLFAWMQGVDIYEFSNKAALPSITKTTVQAWPIPLPPLEEQKRLVFQLDKMSIEYKSLQLHYRTKLQDISDLRQSLLQKAFAGELT